MEDGRVTLRGSEPILPVADVVATVGYYREVLGFPEGWTWGEPPDFGGVRWGKIGTMFSLQPDAATLAGQWHAFFVEGIDALHDLHRRNGAAICSPLEAKPWGLREYTVRDLNGHFLRFGQRGSDRSATAGREPARDVAIVERLPTPEELQSLYRAVGWADDDQADRAATAIAGARFGVVAVREGHAVGSGMVLGDGATFAYLKDIMVRPEWQGRGIGTRIVEALLAILRRVEPDRMLVTLFTGQHLAEFYERSGFSGPETLYGMSQMITCRSGPEQHGVKRGEG
ncbi:MAG: GNAT family N-acetyltransferase [Isosphaeraceae bacterium]